MHTNKQSQICTKWSFSPFSYNVMCRFFGTVSLKQKRSHCGKNAFFSKHKQGTNEHDVHARVVARSLRQQYVLQSCTVVLKTLASSLTDLPYHLPSASVTSLPALVHHSLHLPAISTKVFPTFVPPSGSLSKIFLPTLVWSNPITSYGHSTLFLSISAIPSDI